jgi:hypothetical protein
MKHLDLLVELQVINADIYADDDTMYKHNPPLLCCAFSPQQAYTGGDLHSLIRQPNLS